MKAGNDGQLVYFERRLPAVVAWVRADTPLSIFDDPISTVSEILGTKQAGLSPIGVTVSALPAAGVKEGENWDFGHTLESSSAGWVLCLEVWIASKAWSCVQITRVQYWIRCLMPCRGWLA